MPSIDLDISAAAARSTYRYLAEIDKHDWFAPRTVLFAAEKRKTLFEIEPNRLFFRVKNHKSAPDPGAYLVFHDAESELGQRLPQFPAAVAVIDCQSRDLDGGISGIPEFDAIDGGFAFLNLYFAADQCNIRTDARRMLKQSVGFS